MPVFTRMKEGLLVLTVDGDFTANELRRVTLGAFESAETPQNVPILLDMSGAAGLSAKSSEEMQAIRFTDVIHPTDVGMSDVAGMSYFVDQPIEFANVHVVGEQL